MKPQIISTYDGGKHNANLEATISRLEAAKSYKDLSTIVVIPAHGTIPTRVAMNWRGIITPPNNKLIWLTAVGMEVGEAYSVTIEQILANPDLSKWKYVCFIEHDNLIPQDGLVQLLSRMEENPEYAAIGGLYFTKGEGGVPQIWGDSKSHPLNFRPQQPDANGGLVECNGTGMGFTMFRLDVFKDDKLRKPWFKTTANSTEGAYTQDLYFWTDARKHGHRCAIDCSVKVGHYDYDGKFGPPDTAW